MNYKLRMVYCSFCLEFSMVKSIIIELTYQIGKVELLDLPKSYEREGVIEGRV